MVCILRNRFFLIIDLEKLKDLSLLLLSSLLSHSICSLFTSSSMLNSGIRSSLELGIFSKGGFVDLIIAL